MRVVGDPAPQELKLHQENFSTVGTMSAVLAGFGMVALAGPPCTNQFSAAQLQHFFVWLSWLGYNVKSAQFEAATAQFKHFSWDAFGGVSAAKRLRMRAEKLGRIL